MKNHKVLLVSLLAAFPVFGQEVISSQGETYTNASGTVDFTLGEVVTATVSSGTNDLTQGFHQTNWNFVGIEDLQPDFEVNVFPNPLELELLIEVPNFEGVRFELFDNTGKLVKQAILTGETTHVDVSSFTSGAYQLRLTDQQNQPIKNFKLIKTQSTK